MDGQREWLKVPEVAELLQIARSGAYELVGEGEIPSVRIGRSVRVSRRELEKVAGGTALPGSPAEIVVFSRGSRNVGKPHPVTYRRVRHGAGVGRSGFPPSRSPRRNRRSLRPR